MLHQQVQRKQKSFALQRGLYVVRYEKAADPSQPPMVSIACEAGRNEVILHPEQSRPTMSAPGQALVIRASETGSVHVEISSAGHAASLDATLKFEVLRADSAPPLLQQAQFSPPPFSQPGMYVPSAAAATPVANIQLLGHVARLGDVTVAGDEWLAGPSAPARIEGFLLRWPGRPSDVRVRYGATVAGARPGDARIVELDEFAGSRGRARPVLGLMMELVGSGARNYNLNVEGLFLGAPARRSTGQAVNLTGPTGREPLVGLRIAIATQNAGARPVAQAAEAVYSPALISAAQPPGAPHQPAENKRVRVFRA
ncbi:MAG: hypothetical protein ABL904_12840 [Hyphomicrobiaceae bacterium]